MDILRQKTGDGQEGNGGAGGKVGGKVGNRQAALARDDATADERMTGDRNGNDMAAQPNAR